MQIRRAAPADATVLTSVAEQSFRDAYTGISSLADIDAYCAEAYQPDIQRREILDSGWVTSLAECEGRLIGFVQIRLHSPNACIPDPGPAEINRIYLMQSWQGKGVADQLLEHSLQALMAGGTRWVWLGVWERNPRAIAFYRKYLFSEMGEQNFQLGSDIQRDLVMARNLETG